LDVDAMEHRV